jgi:hypothetical protein
MKGKSAENLCVSPFKGGLSMDTTFFHVNLTGQSLLAKIFVKLFFMKTHKINLGI